MGQVAQSMPLHGSTNPVGLHPLTQESQILNDSSRQAVEPFGYREGLQTSFPFSTNSTIPSSGLSTFFGNGH